LCIISLISSCFRHLTEGRLSFKVRGVDRERR